MTVEIKAPFTEKVMEEITELAVKQDEFGLKKYGQYLDPMDSYDWLNMATEELVDLMKYMSAERHKRDAVVNDILAQVRQYRDGVIAGKGEGKIFVSNEACISMLSVIEQKITLLSKNIDGKSGETTPDKQ